MVKTASVTWLLGALLVAAMACGGDSKKDCGDVGDYFEDVCGNVNVRDVAREWCEGLSCTDEERQEAIDCMLSSVCNGDMENEAMDCAETAGCANE